MAFAWAVEPDALSVPLGQSPAAAAPPDDVDVEEPPLPLESLPHATRANALTSATPARLMVRLSFTAEGSFPSGDVGRVRQPEALTSFDADAREPR